MDAAGYLISGGQWAGPYFFCASNQCFAVGHQIIIIIIVSPVRFSVRGIWLCDFTWNATLTGWADRKTI